ncbi:ABC transporter ATP-binding protein [Varunaivibrio sulfuroxidans]|uniref:Amino acid/amide ABC transporter ATP-binding protein 1 (HAAT family) n=1 Tax=Varunaivibrio sulfuroxidans TaxID=1773489 RepID=A0A4R3J5V8_9PROT|nr:ABC transporter ATP-binding protein [Varunaivibrio sulfuroxidans]TCS61279.1 amino acid/amide ABC transporter ATP-binding protein 1 (HAAT family) [Varunaivibrio sulfuroxidans]WES31103.1 ABC transporter ATP-binding protein [Varunaivibrio sulfuroxidans]
MTILEVSCVSKSFGGLNALSDVNLNVEEGTVHALIGPNGAGKSTLLNVLTGLLRPDKGEVIFDGRALRNVSPHEINQRGIAKVFQTPAVFGELTLLENVTIPALAARDGAFKANLFKTDRSLKDVHAVGEEVLCDVGLQDQMHEQARYLSRGDKRRLELALCLAHRPRLMLLDEPTAGMSRHETERTIDLLKKISSRGVTKVIVEHDMSVVFALSDTITVLAQGQVIAEGGPDAVRGNPKVIEAYLGEEQE